MGEAIKERCLEHVIIVRYHTVVLMISNVHLSLGISNSPTSDPFPNARFPTSLHLGVALTFLLETAIATSRKVAYDLGARSSTIRKEIE